MADWLANADSCHGETIHIDFRYFNLSQILTCECIVVVGEGLEKIGLQF